MPTGQRTDRQKIHEQIWGARDRHDRVQIHQGKFAAHLGISPYHLNRIIHDFVEEGRLKKIASRYRNVGVYVVKDPGEFDGTNIPGLGRSNATVKPLLSSEDRAKIRATTARLRQLPSDPIRILSDEEHQKLNEDLAKMARRRQNAEADSGTLPMRGTLCVEKNSPKSPPRVPETPA